MTQMTNDYRVLGSNIGPFIREIEVFPDPEFLPLPIRREAPATTPVETPTPEEKPILPTNPDENPNPVETPTEPIKTPEKTPA